MRKSMDPRTIDFLSSVAREADPESVGLVEYDGSQPKHKSAHFKPDALPLH